MYADILKKDFKRKKAMNIILLLFICLATIFVASSVNNIVSVTTALDNYLDKAGVPDFYVAIMNKASGNQQFDDMLTDNTEVQSFQKEKVIYLPLTSVIAQGDELEGVNTLMLQSVDDIAIRYFLEDNTVLTQVNKGEIYLTMKYLETKGYAVGDTITITLGDVSKDFVVAGGIKDAILGSDMMHSVRFLINAEDYEDYLSEDIFGIYGGCNYCIQTKNVETVREFTAENGNGVVTMMDRPAVKSCYIFDMVVAGILLAISMILILISFVVLRFTIAFTLSEEYREIGVMKAIGLKNRSIRGLYLVKYFILAVGGACVGLVVSFPFGKMLLGIISKSVIIENENSYITNILCAVFVVVIILLFCYGCTGKVKKYSPIDAIRNGQTGERFKKKSRLSLGKSKLSSIVFLALNDIVSSPRRYLIVVLAFSLCLILMNLLSASANTLKSAELLTKMAVPRTDVFIDESGDMFEFLTDDGRQRNNEYQEELEANLLQNGIPVKCSQEFLFTFGVTHGDSAAKLATLYNAREDMEEYEYIEGTPPQNANEVAITPQAAADLDAVIGDTIQIDLGDRTEDFIITAYFQNMNMQGKTIRLSAACEVNYAYSRTCFATGMQYTDDPSAKEIQERLTRIKELYPDAASVETGAQYLERQIGVVGPLNSIKRMVLAISIILTILITVLMERSFYAKEKNKIAILKAIGFKDRNIYAYHTLRFGILGLTATVLAMIFSMPVTHLFIDPVFRMMGMVTKVKYQVDAVEMYAVFPMIILVVTSLGSLLTSLGTKKITASDTAGIE